MTQAIQTDVSCQNCEACCCRLEVMLFTDTGVPDRYVLDREGEIPVMRRLEDGWCAALDRNTMMCRIYEVRPLICREFEMGEPDCVVYQAGMRRADKTAPGCRVSSPV